MIVLAPRLQFFGFFCTVGSVGNDYKCPWCGRRGAGGYAPDWVGKPLCTEPEFNCLAVSMDASEIQFKVKVLKSNVFCNRWPTQNPTVRQHEPILLEHILPMIVELLVEL